MLIKVFQKFLGFLHHIQIFDVIIEKGDYDIKIVVYDAQSSQHFWPTLIEHVDIVIMGF